MKTCKKCLIPKDYPQARIDKAGICSFCRDYEKTDLEKVKRQRLAREKDLEDALRNSKGKGRYDCIVMLSGGKDSAYLLYRAKVEYGLRMLAFTCDAGGYTGDIAMRNIKKTVNKLNVDHVMYTPSVDFYKKLFSFLLKNQTAEGAVKTVCYVCYPLSQGYALDLAITHKIPLILEGCSPGQPDPEIMVYEVPPKHICEESWLPKAIKESGVFSSEELAHFWDPARYPKDTQFPRILMPFHAWEYNQGEVMKKVVELGLIKSKKWASPVYSNCLLNWLMMYSDTKNFNYNPYLFEFAKLIRGGKAGKWQWFLIDRMLKFMLKHRILLGRYIPFMLKELKLKKENLCIGKKDARDISSHHK